MASRFDRLEPIWQVNWGDCNTSKGSEAARFSRHRMTNKFLAKVTSNPAKRVVNRVHSVSVLLAILLFASIQLKAEAAAGGEPGEVTNSVGQKQQSDNSDNLLAPGDMSRTAIGAPGASIPVAGSNFEAAFQGECGDRGGGQQNSNPCEHICLDLHDGTYECACFYGFLLAVDGYSCSPAPAASSSTSSPPLSPSPSNDATTASMTAPWTYSSSSAASPTRIYNGTAALMKAADQLQVEKSAGPGGRDRIGLEALGSGTTGAEVSSTTSSPELGDGRFSGAAGEANLMGSGKNFIVDKAHEKEIAPSASDKWPSYLIDEQLLQEDQGHARPNKASSSRPKRRRQDNMGDDDDTVEFRYNTEPDIRSIMRSNDRLVKQLARSVFALASSGYSSASADQPDDEQDEREMESYDNTIASRRMDSRLATPNGERQDEQLDQLDRLVRQTIVADYATRSAFMPGEGELIESSPEAEQLIGKETQTPELSSINWRHQIGSAPRDRSFFASLVRAPDDDRDKAGDEGTNATARIGPKLDDQNALCQDGNDIEDYRQDAAGTAYSDKSQSCNQFELISGSGLQGGGSCEAGGQCSLETVYVSSWQSDVARLRRRSRCRCPIGRGGRLCQKPLQRETPRFLGRSYLALPMLTEHSLFSLRLVFKPETRWFNFVDEPHMTRTTTRGKHDGSKLAMMEDNQQQQQQSILLYSEWFLLLLDNYGRVELRYMSHGSSNGAGNGREGAYVAPAHSEQMATRVIGSQDVLQNEWNELIVTDALSDSFVAGQKAHDDRRGVRVNRKVLLVTPEKIQLGTNLSSRKHEELFLAGLPGDGAGNESGLAPSDSAEILDSTLSSSSMSGFTGCIKSLSINGRVYNLRSDLNGDALDGFDVVECCQR